MKWASKGDRVDKEDGGAGWDNGRGCSRSKHICTVMWQRGYTVITLN